MQQLKQLLEDLAELFIVPGDDITVLPPLGIELSPEKHEIQGIYVIVDTVDAKNISNAQKFVEQHNEIFESFSIHALDEGKALHVQFWFKDLAPIEPTDLTAFDEVITSVPNVESDETKGPEGL